jgi:hypothetical protein
VNGFAESHPFPRHIASIPDGHRNRAFAHRNDAFAHHINAIAQRIDAFSHGIDTPPG